MIVHGVGNGIDHGRAVGLLRKADDTPESIEKKENPITEPVEQAEVDEQDVDGESAGVLRLLQEGHFKGVADVRLRINFHDQLVEMQNDNLKDVAAEKLPVFAASIDDEANTVFAIEGLTDEQTTLAHDALATFHAVVAHANEEFAGAENPSADNLQSTIRSGFDTLINSLQEILIPQTIAESEGIDVEAESIRSENTAAAEDTADLVPDFQPFLDAFAETFETGLADLMESLSSTPTLPELSQPSGNGKAYEKFLAIYNAVLGIQHESNPEELPGADVMA